MANPISHLSHLKWKELTGNQLLDVIRAYDEQNKYFNPITHSERFAQYVNGCLVSAKVTREQAQRYFTGTYHSWVVLRQFFKEWNS